METNKLRCKLLLTPTVEINGDFTNKREYPCLLMSGLHFGNARLGFYDGNIKTPTVQYHVHVISDTPVENGDKLLCIDKDSMWASQYDTCTFVDRVPSSHGYKKATVITREGHTISAEASIEYILEQKHTFKIIGSSNPKLGVSKISDEFLANDYMELIELGIDTVDVSFDGDKIILKKPKELVQKNRMKQMLTDFAMVIDDVYEVENLSYSTSNILKRFIRDVDLYPEFQ